MKPVGFKSRPLTRKRVSGFGIGYILGIISLFGVMATGLSAMTSRTARAEFVATATSALFAQQDKIRNAIVLCVVRYPSGNNGTTYNIKYPAGSTAVAVTSLTCPGDPNTNKSIWQGKNGGFLEAPPTGISAWTYINDATGIRFIVTSNGAADLNTALDRVAAKLSSTQATRSGNTLTVWMLQ